MSTISPFKNIEYQDDVYRSYKNSKICYIYQKEIESKYEKDKKYCKLDIIVIIQGNVELLCIMYVT